MKKRFVTMLLLASLCGAACTVVSSCAPPHHLAGPPRPPHP